MKKRISSHRESYDKDSIGGKSGTDKRGLSFDDFKAYKARCLEPQKYLDSNHYFYDFDLTNHNNNSE